MRILVLNERDLEHPLAGGAEVHIFEIFRRLVDAGHEVTLMAASFAGAPRRTVIQGVEVRRLVHRYAYWGVVGFAARREALRGDYDVVVDVLNKLPFLSPWLIPLPCAAIVHHLFGTTAFRQVPLPIALLTWLAEKLIPACYRRVPMLAISPSTADDLAERGIDPNRVWVVPPGVDLGLYQPRETVGDQAPLLAWVGRLEPYKRADVAIDALALVRSRVPDASLIIVGEGSARPALEARALALGLDAGAVSFAGFLSEEAKVGVLQRASVVLQTSEKEGWGMTVIEGNACGAPAVASRVPGLQDAVADGRSGLLVPYGDVGALADAVVRVLTDDDLRGRLRGGVLDWARHFDWDQVASDCLRIMEEARTPGRSPVVLGASPFSDRG